MVMASGTTLGAGGISRVWGRAITERHLFDQGPAPAVVRDCDISRITRLSGEAARIACMGDQSVAEVVQLGNHLSRCILTGPCDFVHLPSIQDLEQLEFICGEWDSITGDVSGST